MQHQTLPLLSQLVLTLCLITTLTAGAAPLYNDLTSGATLSSTGSFNGSQENARDGFYGSQPYITNSATETWLKYSWASATNVGYALVGGNGGRVPDGLKVQYSPLDDGTWLDVATAVTPLGGRRLNYVPIDQNVMAVRVLMTSAAASYKDLYEFRVYGNSTPSPFPLNPAANLMELASVALVNVWEPSGIDGAGAKTAWTDADIAANQVRANALHPTADDPRAILTWADDQAISGLALANYEWPSFSEGEILAMTVDALAEGINPGSATETDWFQVYDYSNSSGVNKLLDLRFDAGTIVTRGLRLTITDVTDSSLGNNRDGGVIDEIEIIGGLVIPEPTSLALLAIGGLGMLRRRR